MLCVFDHADNGKRVTPNLQPPANWNFTGPVTIGRCLVHNDYAWRGLAVVAREVSPSDDRNIEGRKVSRGYIGAANLPGLVWLRDVALRIGVDCVAIEV